MKASKKEYEKRVKEAAKTALPLSIETKSRHSRLYQLGQSRRSTRKLVKKL